MGEREEKRRKKPEKIYFLINNFLFLHPLLLLFLGKERWKGKDEARRC